MDGEVLLLCRCGHDGGGFGQDRARIEGARSRDAAWLGVCWWHFGDTPRSNYKVLIKSNGGDVGRVAVLEQVKVPLIVPVAKLCEPFRFDGTGSEYERC